VRIAIVMPIMTSVTTGGLLSASRITSIPPPPTDEDNLTVEMAKAIAALGHEVTLFASDFYRPLHSVSDSVPGVRVVYLPTRLQRVFHPVFIPFIPTLYRRIRDEGYSVVQSEDFLQWSTILSALASSRASYPLVIWHEINIKQRFPGNVIQSIYAMTLGKAVARRTALFIPRNLQAKDFLLNTGIPSSKIGEVIHSGVNTEAFSPSSDRDRLRQQLGLEPDCFVILSVGRLVPYKGHRYLLLALRKVLDKYPQTRLILVGDGPEKDNLCQLSEDLGIAGDVTMIEHVAKRELTRYYNAADVMALPSSEKELFPNFTILESLACGTPVIFADPAGDKEIGGDGFCGYYAPFGDVDELARRILALIENPQRHIEMSRAAIDLVGSQFDLRVIARKWVQVYEAVTKGGQNGL